MSGLPGRRFRTGRRTRNLQVRLVLGLGDVTVQIHISLVECAPDRRIGLRLDLAERTIAIAVQCLEYRLDIRRRSLLVDWRLTLCCSSAEEQHCGRKNDDARRFHGYLPRKR